MVNRIACPQSSRLSELLTENALEAESLLDHLADCLHCQSVLDILAAGEFSWLRSRALRDFAKAVEKPAFLRTMIDALKAVPLAEHTPTSPSAGKTAAISLLAPTDYPGAIGAIGQYPVLDIVGRGGMGVVFRANDLCLNRVIAVKVLAPEWASNGIARQRFLREARAAAAVAHEHVVTIHAVEEANGLPYHVMEYVSGVSLQERIDRDGPIDPKDAIRIGLQTADGLAAAHRQGLVHRDVKPANILLENGIGRVKLSDFGLARAVDDAGWTAHGTILGTPEYMAPEQAAGEVIDTRADLFSLGCVMYTALTGRPPFRAASTLGVLHCVTTAVPAPLRAANPDVPPLLEAIVMKLLAKKPSDRFASADDVAEEFHRVLFRMQLPDRGDTEPRRMRRGGWLLVLAAVFAFVTLAAVVILKFPTRQGTLVVEIDDPAEAVKVERDGDVVVVTGAGVHELRLNPGEYRATKTGPGASVAEEIVSIERNGRTILKARFEPLAVAATAPAKPKALDVGPGRPPVVSVLPGQIPEKATLLRTFEGQTGTVRAIALLPDGKRFITSSGWPDGDGGIRIWDMVTGKPEMVLTGHKGDVNTLALTKDGKVLISGGQDRTVRAWNVASGKPLWVAAAHTQVTTTVAVSPDDSLIVSGGREGTIKLWDLATGKAIREWTGHSSICRCVLFTPDGKEIISCGFDGTVKVWDAATSKELKSFTVQRAGKTVPVWNIALMAQGKNIITVDEVVGVWDLATGHEIITHTIPGGPTTASVLSDDRSFAICGYDGAVRVFDITGVLRAVVPAVRGWSWVAASTIDGKSLLTGGGAPRNVRSTAEDANTIKLWHLEPATPKTQQKE